MTIEEPYLSENPFRVLGVGSSIPHPSLLNAAQSAVELGRNGRAFTSPLDRVWGRQDREATFRLVESFGSDATLLIFYRVFWPLAYSEQGEESPNELSAPLDDVPEENAQYLFLRLWMDFARTNNWEYASPAFSTWSGLRNLNEFVQRLESIDDSPQTVVYEALDEVENHLLARVGAVSKHEWERGERIYGRHLIEAVLQSGLSPSGIAAATMPLQLLGDAYAEEAENYLREPPDWYFGEGTRPPQPIRELMELHDSLGTDRWNGLIQRWQEGLTNQMLGEVKRKEASGDFRMASTICRQIAELTPLNKDIVRLDTEVVRLEGIADRQDAILREERFEEMKIAPRLRTNWRGEGTMMLGKRPLFMHRRLYFSTQYLVWASIPVLPIGRYLVESVEPHDYHFHGRVRWSKGMKLHAAVVAVLLLALVFYLVNVRYR